MSGHPPRPRRGADPGCARDCIYPRDQARPRPDEVQIHGGRRGPSPARRQSRNESTEDLLRQLPAALGGYRAPDPVSSSHPRQHGLAPRGPGQRRAVSVDGKAHHASPPWALDPADRQEGGHHRLPPWALDVGPGALTVDFSALNRRNRSQGHRQPPWGVDDSSPLPRRHAREATEAQSILPDIRNPGRGAKGREGVSTPVGGRLHSQGRRVQSDSPARQAPGRSTPDVVRDGPVARSVSKGADANAQFRPYMEDRYIAVDPFLAGESSCEQWAFYAVYDGHGGTQAAELCNRELHKQLGGQLLRAMREQRTPSVPLADEVVADALVQTFQIMDDQLLKMGAFEYGSTATVVLVRRSGSNLRLHVANVGDSRALAIDGARRYARVSQDHRPSDESEARRVRQEGGFVQMGRVAGVLAVSRALGDHSYKGAGVSWRPTISVRDATDDMALVIASDGLWDFLDDSDVRASIEMAVSDRTLDLAPRLVGEAKRRGSTDNTCCLVMFW